MVLLLFDHWIRAGIAALAYLFAEIGPTSLFLI